jgi:predicted nuclease of predicted toxin-antitoxin system
LVRPIADIFPGSAHVSDFGLLGGSDREIWEAAQTHALTIVTKDEDFQRLSILYGPPPKVIWVGLGNCPTAEILQLLRRRQRDIQEFLENGEAAFLILR